MSFEITQRMCTKPLNIACELFMKRAFPKPKKKRKAKHKDNRVRKH